MCARAHTYTRKFHEAMMRAFACVYNRVSVYISPRYFIILEAALIPLGVGVAYNSLVYKYGGCIHPVALNTRAYR